MSSLSVELLEAQESVTQCSQLVLEAIEIGDETKEAKFKERRFHFQTLVDILTTKVAVEASIVKLEEDLKVTTQPEEKIKIEGKIKDEKVRFDNLTLSKFIFPFVSR
jgi:hypothetical protein